MTKILIFQHVAYEPLGTLNPLIKERGFRLRYVNFGRFPEERPNLQGYAGLVILGGPMNTDEAPLYPHLQHEIQIIQEALQKNLPILGICLGSQLIAKALGAEVGRNPCREIGWHDVLLTQEGRKDPVLKNFGESEKIFHWHGDSFELPPGGLHLAASPLCPNQAFRYGEKVYGFQFHLEVDEPMIERWLSVPIHLQELQEVKAYTSDAKIREETALYVARLKELSIKTFGAFLDLMGPVRKFKFLPSR